MKFNQKGEIGMYELFEITMKDDAFSKDKENLYYKEGEKILDKHNKNYAKELEEIVTENINKDTIDGNEIIKNNFPTVEVDIFISHSGRDKYNIVCFAGWLYIEFKLESFVDSLIWNSAYDLVDKFKNKFGDKFGEKDIYSHIYTMLSTSLYEMIDNTEVFLFSNTKNSNDNGKTYSPWIYSEITIANMVRKNMPKRHQKDYLLSESVKISYRLNNKNFLKIDKQKLEEWCKCRDDDKLINLDNLYKLFSKSINGGEN